MASGLVSVVSYLYFVVAGRTLSAGEFGVFNALSGIIAIIVAFAFSLQLAVTQAAVLSPGRPALAAFMRTTWRVALPITLLLTFAAFPFASVIGATATQVVLCGIAVLSAFLGYTAMGFLAGIGRIRVQAGVNLLGALARFATGWPLMVIGTGVTGAIVGHVLHYVMILFFAWYASWQLAIDGPPAQATRAARLRLDVSAIATFVLAFVPFTLDQLQMQIFAPSLGDDYAALATMAKLVFFGSYPITAVVYPRLVGQTDRRIRLRLAAAAAGAVICVAGILAFALATFPEFSTRVFFGDRFQQAVPYVAWLALGVACFSLSTLVAHLLIAWTCPIGFLPSLVAFGAGVCLFAYRHDTLATLVVNQVLVYGLQLILALALLAVTIGRSSKRGSTSAII